jgi:hypothetical protein
MSGNRFWRPGKGATGVKELVAEALVSKRQKPGPSGRLARAEGRADNSHHHCQPIFRHRAGS